MASLYDLQRDWDRYATLRALRDHARATGEPHPVIGVALFLAPIMLIAFAVLAVTP